MKSSYELAMERLGKQAPTVKLTDRQKKELAEVESKYAAKIAERELALNGEMDQHRAAGDFEKFEEAQKQLVITRKNLQAEREEKKEQVRQAGRGK